MPPDPRTLQELADALDEAYKLYLSALQAASRGEITQRQLEIVRDHYLELAAQYQKYARS